MDLDLLRIERIRDATRLREEYGAWKRSLPGEKRLPYLGVERAAAIEAIMDGHCLRQTNLSAALERAIDGGKGESRILEAAEDLFEATLDAESTWQFFRYVLTFRGSLELGERLQLADACAADGYLELARRAGLDVKKLPPPVVCPESMTSPATFPRRSSLAAPGLDAQMARTIPLPIVLVPPANLESIWQQTALHHEIGHDLDRDLGLGQRFAPRVEERIAKSPEYRRLRWTAWLGEIIADLVAVLLAGDAFAFTLAALFDGRGMWADWIPDDDHPPPALRAALLARMVERRAPVVEDSAKKLRHWAAAAYQAKPFLEEANTVVDVLLDTPFGGSTFGDLMANPQHDANLVSCLADGLLAAGPLPALDCPMRLVPSAAQIALLRVSKRDGEAAKRIQERALEYLRKSPHPKWVEPEEKWTFLREAVRTMAPTERDTAHGGIKRPPLRLLAKHDEISFVGATNDHLATSLRRATAMRENRKWKRLEIFFLADGPLAWTSHPERTSEVLVQDKQRAMQELCALLPDVAESWAMFEYEKPFYFASYWDVEKPEGRIHVSPYAWGQDVRLCPAIDYLRGELPTPAFQIYSRALDALRGMARRIAPEAETAIVT